MKVAPGINSPTGGVVLSCKMVKSRISIDGNGTVHEVSVSRKRTNQQPNLYPLIPPVTRRPMPQCSFPISQENTPCQRRATVYIGRENNTHGKQQWNGMEQSSRTVVVGKEVR